MVIEVLKCHGTGNDFILIDELQLQGTLDEQARVFLTIKLCDRSNAFGGADGVLFVLESTNCDAKMRILNADGSEAEMCGNGLRCFGRYVIEKTGKNEVKIETLKQDYRVQKIDRFFKEMSAYEIVLGNIKIHEDFDFSKFNELASPYSFQYVTISNPHIIAVVSHEEIFQDNIVRLGKLANERKDIFTEGINLSFVTQIDQDRIYVRTYERGVGLTKSCGTGMIASTTVTCLKNSQRFNQWHEVYNDGGMIRCMVHPTGQGSFEAKFAGNATYIFKGEISVDLEAHSLVETGEREVYDGEAKQYDEFFQFTRKAIESLQG